MSAVQFPFVRGKKASNNSIASIAFEQDTAASIFTASREWH